MTNRTSIALVLSFLLVGVGPFGVLSGNWRAPGERVWD